MKEWFRCGSSSGWPPHPDVPCPPTQTSPAFREEVLSPECHGGGGRGGWAGGGGDSGGPWNSATCAKLMILFILLALVPTCLCFSALLPLDCSEIHTHDPTQPSGVYTIFPGGPVSPLQVYCDMDTDGGGWTVFQRRLDGSVNFYRPWDHYKKGFGNQGGEYWLGLDNIVLLTMRKRNELRVDMEDWDGGKVYAQYTSISVDPETFGYTLRLGSFIDGGAGDGLAFHNGMKFSTFDTDQDTSAAENCAKLFLGAFWYGDCHRANPNGVYRWGADGTVRQVGVEWKPFKGHDYSLKSINMKIRPVSQGCSHQRH
ncbi:microfibril-associated glycoprotein 4-like [Sardina pilchardus]|uniref:microfibril-associated glycoprotein 4-like n=1 Tax=Sardina pilchardus TaxID=27697 RepID=UPI002E112C73